MDQHAGLDIHVLVLVVPMRLKSDGHAVPPIRVNVAQSVADDSDDAFGQHVRLLVQMHMALSRVVESPHLQLASERFSICDGSLRFDE